MTHSIVDVPCPAERVNNLLILYFKLLLLRQSAGQTKHQMRAKLHSGDDGRTYDIVLDGNVPTSTK